MMDRIYYSQEAEALAKRQRQLLAGMFLILGVSVGAALALFFSPANGSRNREYIAEHGNDFLHSGLEKLSEEIANLRERIENLVS